MIPSIPTLPKRLSRTCQTLREHISGTISKRTALIVLVLAVGILTLTAGPTLSQSGTTATSETEVNNSTATPGAEIASAISVEETLLGGELQERTLDITLEEATGDEERVAIVATTVQRLDGRLTQLDTQSQRLQATRDQPNTVSAAPEYAPIAAEAKTINRLLERLQTTATELPASQFEAQYTNATSIERLDARAGALITGDPVSTSIPEPATSTSSTPTTASPTTPSADPSTSVTDRPPEENESTSGDGSDTATESGDDEDDADDSGSEENDDDESDEDNENDDTDGADD
ncbi:hypothetical protein [Halococcus salifodinae]|uniref:Uncharacterized protein n=1 Tax=Halococcus salifodinae DSM 8989 TaxID=1227456 RepID=M0NCN9_9EURY|nr:hypothetical protein [Halococcus salifodinae]EMA55742.1 hypothetical protein C450_00812 [Halococcus salifodinae DSM 8989]